MSSNLEATEVYSSNRTELLKHRLLKQNATTILRGLGFKGNEIFYEKAVQIGKKNPVIDVVGENAKRKVAIEVGQCSEEKLGILETYFDDVIWLPYWGRAVYDSKRFKEAKEKLLKELNEKSLRLDEAIKYCEEWPETVILKMRELLNLLEGGPSVKPLLTDRTSSLLPSTNRSLS